MASAELVIISARLVGDDGMGAKDERDIIACTEPSRLGIVP